MKGREYTLIYKLTLVLITLHYFCYSGNIVVFDDPEAEGKYLSLDQLGVVLKNLSQQLPGRNAHQSLTKQYMYISYIHMSVHRICDC